MVGSGLLVRGYLKALGKHQALEKLKSLPAEVMEPFPEANTWQDSDYQAIIAALRREQQSLSTEMNQRYQDMVVSYTIWAHQTKTTVAASGLTFPHCATPLSRSLSPELHPVHHPLQLDLLLL